MSNVDERELEFVSRLLLRQPQVAGLRKRMDAFAEEHAGSEDVTKIRKKIPDGNSLSDIVMGDREERL